MSLMESTDDPTLAAEVERAIAPYRGIFPPEAVAEMAEMLEHALKTHPVGVALIDRVRPRTATDRSGSRTKDGVEGAPAKNAKKTRAK